MEPFNVEKSLLQIREETEILKNIFLKKFSFSLLQLELVHSRNTSINDED